MTRAEAARFFEAMEELGALGTELQIQDSEREGEAR